MLRLSALYSQKTIKRIASSVLFTAYLCYIDEGAYNFEWVKDASNWIAFVFYSTLFTVLQWFVHVITTSFSNASKRI